MTIFVLFMSLLLFGYYLIQFERSIKDWNDLVMLIFRCAIGLPANFKPQTDSVRVVYAFGLLGGILFSIVASAVIMRNVTTPILRPQIRTIEEITSGEFKLIGDRFAFNKLQQQNQVNLFFKKNREKHLI